MNAESRDIDARIRAASGRGPAVPAIPTDADPFTRAALTAGLPADLVDAARVVDDSLSGAALTSALRKAIEERPGLASPGYVPPAASEGLEGGVRARREQEPVDVNTVIRARGPGNAAAGADLSQRSHRDAVARLGGATSGGVASRPPSHWKDRSRR